MSTTTPSATLRLVDIFGMYHSEMTGQRIVSAECLFFSTQRTVDFLLARVVDCVLVPREIVRSREDSVARLSRRRVNSFALVQIVSINSKIE